MAAYTWQGLNQSGRLKKGMMEADSPKDLRRKLRVENINPTSFELVVNKKKDKKDSFHGGLSGRDLANITRQLSTLIGAKLPLEQSLNTMIKQLEKSSHKNLLTAIRSRLSEGMSFAESLSFFPRAFPDFFVATVAAGEKSGNLGNVLDRLAQYLQTSHETKQKVLMALIYPIIVTIVALLVVTALLVFVVPEMVQVFENARQELPLLTRIMITVSDFLVYWGWLLLIIIGLLVMMFIWLLRNEVLKARFQSFLLGIPFYGRLMREGSISRFVRTFGILLESKVDFIEAMNIACSVVSVLPIKKSLAKATIAIKEGRAVNEALTDTGYFSPLILNLIASGEKSGTLPKMLWHGAENQDRETVATISMIVGIFEPVMILFMGMMVLLIVLAIMVPLFNMNTLL